MVVGMDRALLPQGTFERQVGQGFEPGPLFGKENGIRLSFGGPVDLSTDLFLAPVESPLVGLVDIGEGPAREEMLFDNRDGALDLPLLFGIVAL